MTKKKGFTLIELLVVIAIIAILAAILFPIFSRARQSAQQASCINNCKQLTTAIILYIDDYDGRFPSFTWSQQWKQLEPDNIHKYVKSEEAFHCPGAQGVNSAKDPPTKASENWKNNFGHQFPTGWKYTDYKMMDNGWLSGNKASDLVRSHNWCVAVIDNTDWYPRHPVGTAAQNYNDGGNNIGFLDGHVKHFKKAGYNDGQKRAGPDKDDQGATPFWNWGINRDYWIPE